QRAGRAPGLRIERAQLLHPLGDHALLAERRHPHSFERALVGGGADLGKDAGFQPLDARILFHDAAHRSLTARRRAQSAALALSTSDLKASGSRTARSARTLRSISTPALSRPLMNRP